MTGLERVERFRNESPLWSGEYGPVAGSPDFFEQNRKTCIDDSLAGKFGVRFLLRPRVGGQDIPLGLMTYATVHKPCAE